VEIEPGLFLFQRFVATANQQELWRHCDALLTACADAYATVRGGKKMSVECCVSRIGTR
jgi:hypothetical protein